ncbi:hypothetical protein D3C81_1712810 [compost metagenome]
MAVIMPVQLAFRSYTMWAFFVSSSLLTSRALVGIRYSGVSEANTIISILSGERLAFSKARLAAMTAMVTAVSPGAA